MKLEGTAHKYGDDINTDVIIPGKYTKTLNFIEFKDHVMEDLDENFKYKVKEGDFLVAGNNFGIGSSREQAPLALKFAGVECVVAKSFSRIFYRNAINIGLALVECDTDMIEDKDILEFNTEDGYILNESKNLKIKTKQLNQIMNDILHEGGLVNYIKKNGKFR
jgi:3-isopropylmalate/(R)-2-methylmalate dehydratase small subunit